MPKNNLEQAPRIKNNGEKKLKNSKNGFAMRPHDLETILFNLIDTRNVVQLKVMLFVTGNAEGYSLVQEVTLQRLGISKDSYYKARKALVKRGWLSIEENKDKTYIIVNYDKIYSDGKEFLEKEGNSQNTSVNESNCENTTLINKKESNCENTSDEGTFQNTTDEGNCENTSVNESNCENTTEESNCENTTLQEKKECNCENTPESTFHNYPEGYSDNYYNRINKENKEYDKVAALKEFNKSWGVEGLLTGAAALF